MKLRSVTLAVTLALGLLAAPLPAKAQKVGKVYRIGYIQTEWRHTYYQAFVQGLREVGYVDYKDFVIERRIGGGKGGAPLPNLAAELVRLNVEVIVVGSTPAALAAKNATRTIPVVAMTGDPVRAGVVASLARPGGNVTGVASFAPELSAKRLELLKKAVPEVSRVAILWDPAEPGAAPNLKETQIAARRLRVKILPLEVQGPGDFHRVFAAVTRQRADALLIMLDWDLFAPPVGRILDFAAENRLPTIYSWGQFVDFGGLMSYGESVADLAQRAAIYVDKILKGAKPADLPVEQPTKLELAINLRTAKALGLTIPPSLLFRADRVIR